MRALADTGVVLRTTMLKVEEGNTPVLLIEGDRRSLTFLAEVILAQASFSEVDCGFEISPGGPGSSFFDPRSTVGVYIHSLPCQNALAGGSDGSESE